MDQFTDLSPYISNIQFRYPTTHEQSLIAHSLRIEYAGTGVGIDWSNIHQRSRDFIHKNKLTEFSIYTNIAEKIINTENDAYVKAPIRHFKNAAGVEVDPAMHQYITDLLRQANWDQHLQSVSRYTALEGTTLMMPRIDDMTGELRLIEESPSDMTLEVTPDASDPSKAAKVCYRAQLCSPQLVTLPTGTQIEVSSIEYDWDYLNETVTYYDSSGKGTEFTFLHNYKENPNAKGGMPFAVLRYKYDARRFWGPVDGSMYSICKLRSFLMADAIHRTQSNLFEILVMIGYSPKEAAAMMASKSSGKVIPAELDKDEQGNPIPGSKDIKFVSPAGIEPEKVWEIWNKVFTQFLITRGHSPNAFDVGSKNIQSYEGAKLSNQYLFDLRDSKLAALTQFEKDLFKRVIWANNSVSGRIQIPEDTTVEIDWLPNSDEFPNATDKIAYYSFALEHNMCTPVDIIRREKGVSEETALEIYEASKQFNEKAKPEPIVPVTNLINTSEQTTPPNTNSSEELSKE